MGLGIMRTKNVDTVLHQGDDNSDHAHLQKRLKARDLMGFGIGIVIGTGIFTLTGVQAKLNAGPAVVISFAIAGVVSMLAALCYAELAAAVPTAGSAYTYAYTTIGELAAWIIAWDLLLEFMLGAATVSRGWSGYLQDSLGLPTSLFGEDAPVNVGAILIVTILGCVAAVGIREAKWVTNVLVIVKVAVCIFVIAVGIFFVKASNLTPFVPPSEPSTGDSAGLKQPLWQFFSGAEPTAFGFSGVIVAAAVVFFAYTGFEAVANLGEETENPGRDMPRGLIGSLAVCTLLYLGVCLVLTGMVNYKDLSEGAPISDAFGQVGLEWAKVLVGIAAVAGLTSVILVELVAVPRIMFALSRDGLLPAAVGRISPKTSTPFAATVGVTIVIALISAFVPIDVLAEMVSIGTLFAFTVVAIAVAVLRRTKPRMKRPFHTPAVPLVPILSALSCVGLMSALAVETWLRFLVWLAVGLAIYFGYGRRHSLLDQVEEAAEARRAKVAGQE
jgi:APA family basic amino acid/polyamine antiporter